ncbi:MAG: adenine phosphoribosyltransferase [Bacteroidales bacterium]|jgi:adenine phosphoribosyltransferase|nr:adenine phosphoribosyltransferase [Bacteroidales bacterium]MBR6145703.1 adenine phosphoribosyltransferase [Paludibacteraceae bacterium]
MTEQEVKNAIRNIPDFPQKGIQFKDLTTVFVRPDCLTWLKQQMVNKYQGKGVTKVIGIESRGFIIAPMVAEAIGAGFVPIRKPGKLPAEVVEVSYKKEYGTDVIQIHKDALTSDDIVVLHDDLLATGGTMQAAISLVKQFGVKQIYVDFIVELDALKGREVFDKDVTVESLIHF